MVEHTTAGLTRTTRQLTRAGVDELATERGDGPVVDALLEACFPVLVIAPGHVEDLRRDDGPLAGAAELKYGEVCR